jgi:hypothetical protein
MSLSVALRMGSGTVLYSLGRRRERKVLGPNVRLTNSAREITVGAESICVHLQSHMQSHMQSKYYILPKTTAPTFTVTWVRGR